MYSHSYPLLINDLVQTTTKNECKYLFYQNLFVISVSFCFQHLRVLENSIPVSAKIYLHYLYKTANYCLQNITFGVSPKIT